MRAPISVTPLLCDSFSSLLYVIASDVPSVRNTLQTRLVSRWLGTALHQPRISSVRDFLLWTCPPMTSTESERLESSMNHFWRRDAAQTDRARGLSIRVIYALASPANVGWDVMSNRVNRQAQRIHFNLLSCKSTVLIIQQPHIVDDLLNMTSNKGVCMSCRPCHR
jgi:hypothetical protein